MSQIDRRYPTGESDGDSHGETLDIRSYVLPILRRAWLILGIAVLAAAGFLPVLATVGQP